MISVLIPTWNEAQQLPAAIAAVRRSDPPFEIIVIDAGSTDGTTRVAEQLKVSVATSPVRQRAAQLNLGASQADGDILLFLHADTLLPNNGLRHIESALSDHSAVGGAFARRFDSSSLLLRFTCLLCYLRNRTIGWHLGDQAMFVRTDTFEQLGGFRPIDRFEDLDFSRRLRRAGRLVTLKPPVLTSARRFARDGAALRTMRDFMLTMRYLLSQPVPMTGSTPRAVEHV